jgi:hypothetical protein
MVFLGMVYDIVLTPLVYIVVSSAMAFSPDNGDKPVEFQL